MASDRYLFDHIPKTGGSSMKVIFDDLFGPENVSPIFRAGNASHIMAEMADKIMITGHFWHFPGSLANRDRAYLTLLRRPEDRILSMYYFFRHNVLNTVNEAVALARTMELEDFLMSEEPAILETIHNPLVHHFHQCAVNGDAAGNGERVLAAARDILEQYDFVGIYEDFAVSLDQMCYRFGWPTVPTIPWINRTRDRKHMEDLAPLIRSRLRDLSVLDCELYEHARHLFTKRGRAMMRRFIDLKRSAGLSDVDDRAIRPARPPTSGTGRWRSSGSRSRECAPAALSSDRGKTPSS